MDKGNLIYDSSELKESLIVNEGSDNNGTHEPVINLPDDPKLNPHIRKVLDDYVASLKDSKKGYTPIHVDEIVTRLAKFYEKIRKVIDWKDDNALRRGAIERILKRILFPYISGLTEKKISTHEISEIITVELIRGGHLPNDTIPIQKNTEVANSLEKYVTFLDLAAKRHPIDVKKRMNITTSLLEIAACEIEEILMEPVKEYGLIAAMTAILVERINIESKENIDHATKHKLTFIAVCKSLYNLDDNFITFQLLKLKYPNWYNPKPDELSTIFNSLQEDLVNIDIDIDSLLTRKITSIAEYVDTAFLLTDDILDSLKEKPSSIIEAFHKKKKIEKLITKFYNSRYKTLKTRLFRLAVFSTLSVFLSNWFTFFIVEVPLARLFYERFNAVAAIVDFLVPTILMFLLVIIIKPPKKDNLKKVITTTRSFIYKNENWELYRIKYDQGKPSIFKITMMVLYFYTMLMVFTGIALMFYIAKLPITSVVFDTFTIALTVFAAMTIKNKARELSVDRHTSIPDFLLDIISVPVARVGSVFAKKWKEYNIVAILFNFIIETPLALIFNFISEWSEFIKDRRAELR
jgi:hypothetical protein